MWTCVRRRPSATLVLFLPLLGVLHASHAMLWWEMLAAASLIERGSVSPHPELRSFPRLVLVHGKTTWVACPGIDYHFREEVANDAFAPLLWASQV